MKKVLVAGLLLIGLGVEAKAEDSILFKLGTVDVLLPFADVSAVYLFDGKSKTSLVGAETPLVGWHKLQLTGGAITSIDGAGSPFVGLNLELGNPVSNYISLSALKIGVFAGRNFNTNEYMAGVKAATSIFN